MSTLGANYFGFVRNWFERSGTRGQEISGQRNVVAYNYYSRSTFGMRFASGEQYTPQFKGGKKKNYLRYTAGSHNIISNNVVGGSVYMVQAQDRTGTAEYFRGTPTDNLIENNDFYTDRMRGTNASGAFENEDGEISESEFKRDNDWGQNNLYDRNLASSNCANSSLFQGPGGSSISVQGMSGLFGSPNTVYPPSWW